VSEIKPAIPELTALALATRPGWTETAVTGAILAAKTAGWSWPRTLTRMARLAADPDAEPQQMLDELRDPLKRAAGTPPETVHERVAGLRAQLPQRSTEERPMPRLGPDHLVDEVAVFRAASGEPVPLTRRERAEAARVIIAAGGTPWEIAKRLRTSGTRANQLYEAITGEPFRYRSKHATRVYLMPLEAAA